MPNPTLKKLQEQKIEELLVEIEDNRQYALRAWHEGDVIVKPCQVREGYPLQGYVEVTNDPRYTEQRDPDREESDSWSYLGCIFFNSEDHQAAVSRWVTGNTSNKKDVANLTLDWDWQIKLRYESYLEDLEAYKLRQQQIQQLRQEESVLVNKLAKLCKHIESLNY